MPAIPLAQRDARSGSLEAAAVQTKGKRGQLYLAIQAALTAADLTDNELIARVQGFHNPSATPSGIRSRRNELVMAGYVTELRDADGVPLKRKTATGMGSQVWRLVRPGEDHKAPAPTRRARAVVGDTTTPEHQAGLAAAQRMALWHTGDENVADFIVAAYLDPAEAQRTLDGEGAPEVAQPDRYDLEQERQGDDARDAQADALLG